MTTTGKSIRIYLVDGAPNGIWTAEIINWTGKVIVAPRSKLADVAKREEVNRTGIYCLVGQDPENPTREMVYVGEGDNVLTRLTSHDKDEGKDFWTRAAIVISKDENLTKSHGRYLESRLIENATRAGRAKLANGTAPATPVLPEPDVADMEFFIEQIQMMFPVLGFSFLQPKPVTDRDELGPSKSASPIFRLTEVGTNARAREIDGEFIVLKGSTARKTGAPSWTTYKSLRDQLVQDGKLRDSSDPEHFEFSEDIAFSSPSAGAAAVVARNSNGRTMWKVEGTGQSYSDWYDAKLDRSATTADQCDD